MSVNCSRAIKKHIETSGAQNLKVRDECDEIERAAEGFDAVAFDQMPLSEIFEAVNGVFVDDEEQIAGGRFERLVDRDSMNVANELFDDFAIEIVDYDAIRLRHDYVG